MCSYIFQLIITTFHWSPYFILSFRQVLHAKLAVFDVLEQFKVKSALKGTNFENKTKRKCSLIFVESRFGDSLEQVMSIVWNHKSLASCERRQQLLSTKDGFKNHHRLTPGFKE